MTPTKESQGNCYFKNRREKVATKVQMRRIVRFRYFLGLMGMDFKKLRGSM